MTSALETGLVIIHSFPHSFTNLIQHLGAKSCSRGRCHTAGGSLVTGKGDMGRWTEGCTARRGSLEWLYLGCPEA